MSNYLINGCRRVGRYFVYRLMKGSECSGILSILDWMDNWLLLNVMRDNKKKNKSYYCYMLVTFFWDFQKSYCVFCLCLTVLNFTRNHIRASDLLESFINGSMSESPFLFDSSPVIPLLLVNNNGKIPSYLFHIHRDRGHNTHGYSKSCLGCFNGSLYIFPFTRSMGKKWALGVLLIGLRNQTVSIVF